MMGSTVNTTGPWILHKDQDLSGLVDKLNTMLPLQQGVHVVEYDTAMMPHNEMTSRYSNMSPIEPVHVRQRYGESDQPRLHIPIGLWIIIPTRPLLFEGKLYPASVDIQGDHIVIQVPYLFKDVPDRVDQRHYAIIARESHW